MTLQQAQKKAKYFGEGVVASMWCYHGKGDWMIEVARGRERATFYDIDSLKRSIAQMWSWGDVGTVCLPGGTSDLDNEVCFHGLAEARECVRELRRAWDYIRSQPAEDNAWEEISATIFEPPREEAT